MGNTKKTIILSLFIFAGAINPAFAQGPQQGGPRISEEKMKMIRAKMKEEMDKILDEIGVTEEQKQKLQENRREHMQEFKETHTQMRNKEKELRELLKGKEVDMTQVEKVKKELLDLKAKDIDQKIQGTLWMKQVLTESQLEQLSEKMEQRRGRFGAKRDHFRKKGFGNDPRSPEFEPPQE